MKIGAINCSNRNNYDLFGKSAPATFEGRPWPLPYIPVRQCQDAVEIHSLFSLGNYLDANDDDVAPENIKIREKNYGFLDALKYHFQKEFFINYYKKLTSFPDLEKVSQKIEEELVKALKLTEEDLGDKEYGVLAAGYDKTCSVGRGLAFPGSDLDKSFVIIRGCDDADLNKQIVQNFKNKLWEKTDQRLLSFNHDISFPNVCTVKEISDNLETIEKKTSYILLDEKRLIENLENEYQNLEKATEYNKFIAANFKDKKNTSENELSKQAVKNFAFLIESIREGKILVENESYTKMIDEIEDYNFYKYTNLGQMRSMRNAITAGIETKSKMVLRENLKEKFDSWTVEKQYNFIKNLIKYSSEDNTDFQEYFKNDRDFKNLYKNTLNIISRGNENLYNRPEFKKLSNGILMEYGINKSVMLMKSIRPDVLWIESREKEDIEEVILHIEKIKQSEYFSSVKKIHCLKPHQNIENFYKTTYSHPEGTIYERIL